MLKAEAAEVFNGAGKVSLEEVSAFREEKARRQEALLEKYAAPLLCLGINIPGEYKRFFLADCSFREGLRFVCLALKAERISILYEEVFEHAGGCAGFISVNAEPEKLKELSRLIEDSHPLGRLFDIDVLRREGGKISRKDSGEDARACLICGGDAFVCGRSRAHSAGELQNIAADIMLRFRRDRLADLVAAAALRALMGEAAITPKPGLVDRANNGAHQDMDFFSFIDSSAAIIPYFRDCARTGFDAAEFPLALFERLRPGGKITEIEMRGASAGANTHRGVIFSIGLASAAFGAFFRSREKIEAEEILGFVASMTCRVTEDFGPNKEGLSHGETIHRRYGIGGVREEARRGFPAVRDRALPALRRALAAGYRLNDAGLAAFLHLLGVVMDTNIIHRSNPETLMEIQKNTAVFLAADPGPQAIAEYAAKLDGEFTAKNISPGGCADLLALSLFLHWLCVR
ncbi:MAG: citrate lyase holo-[acyl-carrier protein] synthase [Treponema sp.]|nr:citrate lyase holo-[acyl-carrier protein] synthase [Treponema sp.]